MVRDKNHRHALALEFAHDLEQQLGFTGGQRRGRLIEHQQARIQGQGLGDFDKLLLGHAQVLDGAVQIDADPEALEQRLRSLGHFAFAQQAEAVAQLMAEEDIFYRREVGNQAELLEHNANPGGNRIPIGRKLSGLPVDKNLPFVLMFDTAQNLHQGGFARAIFPEQGVDFAALHLQVDGLEGLHPRVTLTDVFQLQKTAHTADLALRRKTWAPRTTRGLGGLPAEVLGLGLVDQGDVHRHAGRYLGAPLLGQGDAQC